MTEQSQDPFYEWLDHEEIRELGSPGGSCCIRP